MSKPTRVITTKEFMQVKAWSKLSDAKLEQASTAKLQAFRQILESYNNRTEYFEFEQIEETPRDQALLGSWYFTAWRSIVERVDSLLAAREFDAMFAEFEG